MATAARMLDDRPLILVTTVDIGRGRTDVIELRQGDSPEVWDTSGHMPFHDSQACRSLVAVRGFPPNPCNRPDDSRAGMDMLRMQRVVYASGIAFLMVSWAP